MGLRSLFVDKEWLEVSESALCWTEGRVASMAWIGGGQDNQGTGAVGQAGSGVLAGGAVCPEVICGNILQTGGTGTGRTERQLEKALLQV